MKHTLQKKYYIHIEHVSDTNICTTLSRYVWHITTPSDFKNLQICMSDSRSFVRFQKVEMACHALEKS